MTENNSLMKMLDRSTKLSSLKDLVRARTAENPVLLIDCSSSMGQQMSNGKTRIQGLREVVTGLQAKRQTPMIAFGPRHGGSGDTYELMATGQFYNLPVVGYVTEVPNPEGMTPMAEAIDFARENGAGRAVVISDGGPNDPRRALEAARMFGGQIDVIYVGDEHDSGSFFMDELAKATGGTRFQGDLTDPKELTGAVVGLLNGEVLEQADDDEDEDDDDTDDDDDDEDDDEA